MKRFQAICIEKGWEMPPVKAFEISPEQQRKEDRILREKATRGVSFGFEVDDGAGEDLELSDRPATERYGDGSVSELSSRSGGTRWSSNPIANYMREMEYKTQQAKAEQVAKARQIAADRLVPRDLPSYKLARLEELKAAKAKKLG